MRCKTYCFAFQKHRFCTVKAALLQRKTYAFATSKRNYHFSIAFFFTKQNVFLLKSDRNNKKKIACSVKNNITISDHCNYTFGNIQVEISRLNEYGIFFP